MSNEVLHRSVDLPSPPRGDRVSRTAHFVDLLADLTASHSGAEAGLAEFKRQIDARGANTDEPEDHAVYRHSAILMAIYRGILARDPDPDALRYYLPSLCDGSRSPEDTVRELIDSGEFRSNYLSRSSFSEAEIISLERLSTVARSFITDTYHAVLERAPDPGAIEHYTSTLRSGALSRQDLLRMFIESPEFRSKNFDHSMLPVLAETMQELQNLLIDVSKFRAADGAPLRVHGSRPLDGGEAVHAMVAIRDLALALRDVLTEISAPSRP
ncbi:DUF4214 domain-containing protein [Methylobacterium oxalidis]|uniref:DUF4214 domain-containing protein n=1 Tax=Methylobacterium oxalidis TaxID=944322 RepID=A0A512JB41_9HYPH|nr:DUF4214 domain-containing protein [Methylobacterium oxalidis]GEP07200.1 hypothetical protein MOX02_52380 [Methylobacterium oxalidis]GJE31495.1 hypothetical protein LDDCCGHA_1674 [Methylobacterium oxalidis]GLS65788.1 hypothetical protein GCM10007888_41700 [Methylobacterium oxalidis]